MDLTNLERHLPEGLCLLAYRGSIAHNMYVPNTDPNSIDDIDLIGIVLAPPEYYLGLREWGSRGTKEYKEGKWDCVFYDIRKTVSLLLQGNPNIMSFLWTKPHHFLRTNDLGKRLIENRHLFVGRHVYNSFAGYAHAQIEKMTSRDPAELREYMALTVELKKRGAHPDCKHQMVPYPPDYDFEQGEVKNALATSTDRLLARLRHFQKKGENLGYMGYKRRQLVLQYGADFKNGSHCIRLLRMAKEFLSTGEMIVYRDRDSDELLDIKRGKWTLDQVKQHAEELFQEIKAAREKSPLPEGPDYEGAEKLLMGILRDHLGTKSYYDYMNTPRHYDEWHEDHGFTLWHRLPVCEPPYCGDPLCCDWPYSDEDEKSLCWTPLPDGNEISKRGIDRMK